MFIAQVIGDVIATHRHGELGGHKLLLVRRESLDGALEGGEVIALDVIGVGVGERVLVVQEGGAARSLFQSPKIPAQAVVVGVVDSVDLDPGSAFGRASLASGASVASGLLAAAATGHAEGAEKSHGAGGLA